MDFEQILKDLNSLPIFKMSLGSKELFHSNFLEYLWSIDKQKFIGLINDLFGKEVLDKNNSTSYELSREKENFDICIHHQDGTKTIYDVVIENKVKSIPNKKQLDDYVDKVKNHKQVQDANYLLLSLIENFPDKAKIKNWEIANYDRLCEAISNNYKGLSGKDATYIQDYLEFIKLMQKLEKEITPLSFTNEKLWSNYKDYKAYRLHDLYIKLRGLRFIALLKDKLDENGITSDIVSIAGDKLRMWYNNTPDTPKHQVYLNWNVFNAVGQIAAFIYCGGNEIYEIVVQGDQYRHGINYYDDSDTQLKSWIQNKNDKAIAEIWNKVGNNSFMNGYYWKQNLQLFNTQYRKGKTYCQYKPDYVYRYRDISTEEIGDLLKVMVEDIQYTCRFTKVQNKG